MSIPRRIRRFVPNLVSIGPAVWQLPQTFECVTTHNVSKCPWCNVGRIVVSLCPFPYEAADVYQMWCQSVQPFDSFPILLNVWPPTPPPPEMPPGELRGDFYLACVHAQMNPRTWTKVGANRSSRFTASQDFLNLWHPNPPPQMPLGVLRGDLYLAYVHSQMNPQTWTKVGANRTASPDFLIVHPLKPPVSRGAIFGVYPFTYYEFAHVCQIWCQSALAFGSFSRIGAKVSSAFHRCTSWLAQKHAKNNMFTSKIKIPQTSTSLTFFTAML